MTTFIIIDSVAPQLRQVGWYDRKLIGSASLNVHYCQQLTIKVPRRNCLSAGTVFRSDAGRKRMNQTPL